MRTPEELYDAASSSKKGSFRATLDELEAALPLFWFRGYFVQSMEASGLKDGWETP